LLIGAGCTAASRVDPLIAIAEPSLAGSCAAAPDEPPCRSFSANFESLAEVSVAARYAIRKSIERKENFVSHARASKAYVHILNISLDRFVHAVNNTGGAARAPFGLAVPGLRRSSTRSGGSLPAFRIIPR
jgi:hypothetical protein